MIGRGHYFVWLNDRGATIGCNLCGRDLTDPEEQDLAVILAAVEDHDRANHVGAAR